MIFIVWGWEARTHPAQVHGRCPCCGFEGPIATAVVRKYWTLFWFIPLGSTPAAWAAVCPSCGYREGGEGGRAVKDWIAAPEMFPEAEAVVARTRWEAWQRQVSR